MISQRVFLAIVIGVVALGGCKGSKGPVAPSGAAGPIAAAAPARKPGLWRLVGDDGTTVSLCLDEAADKKTYWWGAARSKACEENLEKQADGSWKFSTTCKAAKSDTAISWSGEARGDFQSSYSLDGEISVVGYPDPKMNGVRKFTNSATYAGECPATLAPGMMDIPGQGIIDPTTGSAPQ
ncbi:MAG: hypothetical protein JWM33_929 [Caulobacteraceae bacterium]|nr:hypothetical protein [Caulobacteraceae bacterium]